MGAPAELYDSPATTFVSNFLGQSNLVKAEVVGRDGEDVVVDAHGSKARCARVARPSYRGHGVGRRPAREGLPRRGAGSEAGDGTNLLGGGTVSDVSFIGVSTQYLVRMPWGQELTVFEQNSGARERLPGRATRSTCTGRAAHTFLLDADQDAHAGDESYAALAGEPPARPA